MIVDVSNGNGISAPDRLTRMIAELQEVADDYALEVAEAQATLDEVKAKAAGIQKALTLLKGEPAPAKRRQRRSPTGNPNPHGWTPSEERIASVLAALHENEQLNVTEIAERTGHSREVAKKSLDILREREQVRFVGTSGRGGAKMFALMPNG